MSKENISATVDEFVKEYLNDDGVNTSGLVNKLLVKHIRGGADDGQILEFRIEQVESQLAALEDRVARKEDELTELRSRKQKMEEEREENLQKAASILGTQNLDEDDTKVNWWADECDMTVEEFITTLEEGEYDQ